MQPRICESADCRKEFDPISPRQTFCTDTCGSRERQRRYRAKRRKGGGGGGNGGGGGESPTLFDSIMPQNPGAFVPIPVIGPKESDRKPSSGVTGVTQRSHKAAA